ncbi:MAG: hypothetical protein A4S17_10365 [Proteobacteria bacterium HN_bin10]|jgi:hypothetical protein|nr:MAG: hypothetical protein A4S17_10365 [Proteobacteria bacterium HN_bin10]
MTNLDHAIREALSKEDAEFLDRFEKTTPIGEVMDTFRGRWALLNAFAAIITFAAFGFFVYAMLQIMNTDDLRMTVLWAAAAVTSAFFVGLLKIWFWMEMHRNQVLREVKRLELQVARLAAR